MRCALGESRKSKVESRKSKVGSRKSKVESRKMEDGSRKSKVESRKSKVESRKMEVESRKSEDGRWKTEDGRRKMEDGRRLPVLRVGLFRSVLLANFTGVIITGDVGFRWYCRFDVFGKAISTRFRLSTFTPFSALPDISSDSRDASLPAGGSLKGSLQRVCRSLGPRNPARTERVYLRSRSQEKTSPLLCLR
jgi:hypothetical protein